MHQQSLSLYEFQQRFPDEQACQEHLFHLRWPEGYRCPRCHGREYYTITTRTLYECRHCHYQTSVTAGTLFHRTQTPLHVWFWVVFLVAKDKRGVSAAQISREFPVSYPTAWTMLQKIRQAMEQRDDQYQLAGIVELDEAYFGAPTTGQKRGRGTQRSAVLVSLAVSADGHPRFANLHPVPDLHRSTIEDYLEEQTAETSEIHTDALSTYQGLTIRAHRWVKAYQADLSEAFRWLHTVISNAKAFIAGTYHGIGAKHLSAYLAEYCYRFNRRFWQDQLFDRLLYASVHGQPVTYTELT